MRKTMRFKVIKAVYETLSVNEPDIAEYASHHYTSSAQVADFLYFLKPECKEYFITLHLDGKNRILCLDMVSQGSLNQSLVHPREVFKTAMLSSAAAMILVHNHPSGDPTPSGEDKELTHRLIEGAEILGIRVLDHIIIGDSYFSFAERGLI